MRGWEVLALVAAALFLKQVLLVFVQIGSRLKDRSFRYEEDAKMMNGTVGDGPLTKRAQAAIDNSIENELFFLVLLFAYLSTQTVADFQPHREAAELAATYGKTFVAARFSHALFMLGRVGALRTVAFMVGWLAAIGIAVQLVMEIL